MQCDDATARTGGLLCSWEKRTGTAGSGRWGDGLPPLGRRRGRRGGRRRLKGRRGNGLMAAERGGGRCGRSGRGGEGVMRWAVQLPNRPGKRSSPPNAAASVGVHACMAFACGKDMVL